MHMNIIYKNQILISVKSHFLNLSETFMEIKRAVQGYLKPLLLTVAALTAQETST